MRSSTPDVDIKTSNPARIVSQFHILVRIAHWLNIPILLGLILSGLSIYWAAPVFKVRTPEGEKDVFAIVGELALRYIPGQTGSPRNWFFDHFAMGSGNLAYALNIHWLYAYLFMIISVVYIVGSISDAGYKALLPQKSDLSEGLSMVRYYLQVIPAYLLGFSNPHPIISRKYNALQRTAYASVNIVSLLAILSGWAMHKPSTLGWLQYLLGGYDSARIIHFLAMIFFLTFVVPHVVLVIAAGWNCFRSMVVGWSEIEELP